MSPPSRRPAPSAAARMNLATVLLRVVASIGLAAVLVVAPALTSKPDLKPVAQLFSGSVRNDQWQIDTLKAEKAWKISTGAGVKVAVVDSGVAGNHPDLAGRVLPGTDLVEPGGDGSKDAVGHGTTVAGLIAGRNDDDRGVVGLAPDAQILPVRVLDGNNKYDDAKVVAEGVVWAVNNGARVINLSLGGKVISPALAEAIDYAFASDVVVVACVGNVLPDGSTTVWHPASEPGVIAVTALNQKGEPWRGALAGPQTVLAAPGTDLLGAKPGGYQRVQGTSFASPLVAATAALIRSKWPQMSAANVVQRLIATARDEGTPGRDDGYGFGVVDPYAALTAEVPEVLTNPLDTTPPPGKSGFGAAAPEPSGVPSAPVTPSIAPSTGFGPIPDGEKPIGLAAALAGFAALVGGGLTLIRRL
ncbi:MAG TPA: type VII secretion-associated serine protease mycosin [Micromonosporaceae bacterium]|nr:type VII secretion-associated serine protease mycosin [Micromonosporaceae bacterium]